MTPSRPPVGIALAHHANQYIITNGYEDRDGISRICEGYTHLLELHRGYGVPINLHFSGTLLESIAWHHPEFLDLVKELAAEELVFLVGGAYAENIMTLFSPSFNRRQLDELLRLYRDMLDCPPESVKYCWVPERVWRTSALAPVLTDESLANGGFRYVLLDDRLLFPTNGAYPLSPRASFDLAGPYDVMASLTSRAAPQPNGGIATELAAGSNGETAGELSRTYAIKDGNGLVMVPISANLRYWVPPRNPDHWRLLDNFVSGLDNGGGETLLVYADDLEKAAGVAGWENTLDQYDAFLRWLVERSDHVTAVRLDTWLEAHPPREERTVESGTFFELAQEWNAGEDYRGWWGARSWSAYRGDFTLAHDAVRAAGRDGGDKRLLALAAKHLLASAHETAWHDKTENGDGRAPAPWARAVASHSRSCLPMITAAEWFSGGEDRQPQSVATDVDADSEQELVLRNRDTFAVITPGYGGRIVYLFHRLSDGGVMVIGNPTDHWNFQEALNRYMDQPPNHPGALADVDFEHDPYELSALVSAPGYAFAQLVNVGDGILAGTRKSFLLPASSSAMLVRYELPDAVERHATEACLSPDYHRLLRKGRRHLRACGGRHWKGFRNGEAWVWLALAPDEETDWADPANAEAGHGVNLRVQADVTRFDLLVGCGQTDDERARSVLELARPLIDEQTEMSSRLAVVREESSVDYVLSRSDGVRGNPETSASGSRWPGGLGNGKSDEEVLS